MRFSSRGTPRIRPFACTSPPHDRKPKVRGGAKGKSAVSWYRRARRRKLACPISAGDGAETRCAFLTLGKLSRGRFQKASFHHPLRNKNSFVIRMYFRRRLCWTTKPARGQGLSGEWQGRFHRRLGLRSYFQLECTRCPTPDSYRAERGRCSNVGTIPNRQRLISVVAIRRTGATEASRGRFVLCCNWSRLDARPRGPTGHDALCRAGSGKALEQWRALPPVVQNTHFPCTFDRGSHWSAFSRISSILATRIAESVCVERQRSFHYKQTGPERATVYIFVHRCCLK